MKWVNILHYNDDINVKKLNNKDVSEAIIKHKEGFTKLVTFWVLLLNKTLIILAKIWEHVDGINLH